MDFEASDKLKICDGGFDDGKLHVKWLASCAKNTLCSEVKEPVSNEDFEIEDDVDDVALLSRFTRISSLGTCSGKLEGSVKKRMFDNTDSLHISVKKSKVLLCDDRDEYEDEDGDLSSDRAKRLGKSVDKSFSSLKKGLEFVEKSFEECRRKRREEEKRLESVKRDIVEYDKELGNKKKLAGCVRRINEIHKKMLGKVEGCVKDFVGKEAQLGLIEDLIGERKQELRVKEIELGQVMNNTSKEREFKSQMKDLVDDLLLKQKHFERRTMELELKEKKQEELVMKWELKEREFEGQMKELESEKRHFESRLRELQSKEKQNESWVKEHESKVREFDCQVKELLGDLELKQKHFESQVEELKLKEMQLKGKVKEVETKEKQLDGRVKEFDLKEAEFKSRVKELESENKQLDGRVKEFDSKEDEFKGRMKELESEKKQLESRLKEFVSKEKKFKEQMKESESKEEEFKDQVKVFESKEEEFESRVKEFNSKEKQFESKIEEIISKEKQFEERWKTLESKEKQFEGHVKNPESKLNKHEEKESATSYMDDESSPPIDETRLQLVSCEQSDILARLRESSDPAELVLDIIQNPILPHCDKKGETGVIVDDRCIYLLEQLMKISPNIKPHVRGEALKLALELKANIKQNSGDSLVVLGFLLILSIYGLVTSFDEDEVLELFASVAQHKIALELFRPLSCAN